jgi:integrating conjugative element protein (TIGR03759 family)
MTHRSVLAAVMPGGTIVFIAALLGALDASAEPPSATHSRLVPSQVQPTADTAADERHAREWGLRPEEWARYRQLLQGPLGVYSPNLDPLTTLGIEARSEEERQRYAQLQVQTEARRVDKMLAYQRAYDAAWQRLFPGQLRVNFTGIKPVSAPLNAADAGSGRLAVFVKADCTTCVQRVQALQAAGTAFDVYMVGSRQDDTRIRQWAAQAGIDPARVRSRTITLNHDAGRWLSLGLPGELPAVVREVNGQWQRQ